MIGPASSCRLRLYTLLALGALAIVALAAHLPGLNGPWYHKWPWRALPAARVYGLMILGALPLGAALWAWERGRLAISWALTLMACGTLLLQLLGAMSQTERLRLTRVADAVTHADVTSYFLDAIDLQREPGWLASFPERMGSLHQHSRNKPPGAILFHTLVLHLFLRQQAAAAVAGLLIGVLAALGVPAAYFLARALGGSPASGVYTAACLAVCPSLVLFFPEFDQVHPAMAAVMLGAWALAVRRGSLGWAALCGLALALASLFTFAFLVLGPFFVGYEFDRTRAGRASASGVMRAAATTLGVAAACYTLLWLVSGYRPIDTFFSALRNEALLAMDVKPRPYLPSLLFDPLDFALGMGYLPLLLATFYLAHSTGAELTRAARIGLAQIVLVAVTGLLRCETARIWLLLAPLLMLAAGAELERWDRRSRWLAYLGLLLVTASVARNLEFITL